MPAYEAMFIFRPGLKEEEEKTLVGQLENILKESQAEIESSKVFGRRQLAYEINKHKEGLYYLINFSAPAGEVISRLKKACGMNENVLRILVIKCSLKEAKNG